MGKTHENIFPGAHYQKNIRLLPEASLRVNSHCVTFYIDFTQ